MGFAERTEVCVGVGGGVVSGHRLGEVAEVRVRGLRSGEISTSPFWEQRAEVPCETKNIAGCI